MNEFELYPAGKEETTEFVKQGSTIITYFQEENSGSQVYERLQRGVSVDTIGEKSMGNVCNNSGEKISEKW